MRWFERMKSGLKTRKKKEIPEGLWVKCKGCGGIVYRKELEENLWVCPKCEYHFRIKSESYIKILIDDGKFQERDSSLTSVDFLKFKASKSYTDKLKSDKKKTGKISALQTGVGQINGRWIALGVMDFSFIGGSMGSVVGEKLVRLIDTAIKMRFPLVILSASGGARVQEGLTSLMQMSKTCAKLVEFSLEGLLYISVLTNPCTAGVLASYASLGDIIIAEPGTLIRFSGSRVTKEITGQEMPEGFQPAEEVLKNGFLDMIVKRNELKSQIFNLIDFFA